MWNSGKKIRALRDKKNYEIHPPVGLLKLIDINNCASNRSSYFT
jgi:hypothetical protein